MVIHVKFRIVLVKNLIGNHSPFVWYYDFIFSYHNYGPLCRP
jgi:hypothetical protein